MKLRGLNQQNAKLITDVNNDVLQCSIVLLRSHGLVIFEEALVRTGHRKNRALVQWPSALKPEIEDLFGLALIRLSRTFLREQIKAQFDNLKVLRDVAEHIEKRGNGHQTAGYCFPAKYEDLTKRQINHRRHMAEGNERAAMRLEEGLGTALPKPPNISELPRPEV